MAPRQASSAQKQLMQDRAEVTAARQDAAELGDHELVAVLDLAGQRIPVCDGCRGVALRRIAAGQVRIGGQS